MIAASMDLAGSRMRREAIQGALIGLTLYLGIPLGLDNFREDFLSVE